MTLVLADTNVVWTLKLKGYLVGLFICLHCELDHLVDNSPTWAIVHLNFHFFFKPLIFSQFFLFLSLFNFSTFCLSFTILSLWKDWPLVFSFFGLTCVCLDIKFLFKFNSKVSLSSSSFSLSSYFAKRPFFQKIVELFIFTVFVWTKKSTLLSSSSTQSQFQGLSFDFHWESSTKRSDEALLFVKHYWMSSLTSQPLHCKNDMVIEWPFISL